jgi:catechol 2,3-dioxygenase-like lactoylglutathione lyase family enzyme
LAGGNEGVKVDQIDHVALAVRNVERSVAWYEATLGLERRHQEVWGSYPAVVCAGTTCVALFPVGTETPKPPPDTATIAMRHVGFRVDRATFAEAQAGLRAAGIHFVFQDHTICHSVYLSDPDGHQIEITTYEL